MQLEGKVLQLTRTRTTQSAIAHSTKVRTLVHNHCNVFAATAHHTTNSTNNNAHANVPTLDYNVLRALRTYAYVMLAQTRSAERPDPPSVAWRGVFPLML